MNFHLAPSTHISTLLLLPNEIIMYIPAPEPPPSTKTAPDGRSTKCVVHPVGLLPPPRPTAHPAEETAGHTQWLHGWKEDKSYREHPRRVHRRRKRGPHQAQPRPRRSPGSPCLTVHSANIQGHPVRNPHQILPVTSPHFDGKCLGMSVEKKMYGVEERFPGLACRFTCGCRNTPTAPPPTRCFRTFPGPGG